MVEKYTSIFKSQLRVLHFLGFLGGEFIRVQQLISIVLDNQTEETQIGINLKGRIVGISGADGKGYRESLIGQIRKVETDKDSELCGVKGLRTNFP